MQANEDIHLIKLHGQKETSKNQRTQFKIIERQEPLARMLTIDSASEQIDDAKQVRAQEMLSLLLAEAKELKRISNKRLARAIEKKASNLIHSLLQMRLAGHVDSLRNVKSSIRKQENLDTSETSNPTSDQDREGEEHSQAVGNVESRHVKTRVNNRVTFSDKRDYEIRSESPVECNSRPNEWRMPDKINLDSSGLRRSDRSAVLSRRDKVYSHSTKCLKSVKRSSEHACLVLFSSFHAIGAEVKCGVHSHQVLAKSPSQNKTSFAFLLIASAKCHKSSKTCSTFKAGRQSNTKSFDVKSSSIFKLVVASVDWIPYVESNETGCVFLSVARAKSIHRTKTSNFEVLDHAPKFLKVTFEAASKLIIEYSYSKIYLHFCKDCNKFREGECKWKSASNPDASNDRQRLNN